MKIMDIITGMNTITRKRFMKVFYFLAQMFLKFLLKILKKKTQIMKEVIFPCNIDKGMKIEENTHVIYIGIQSNY